MKDCIFCKIIKGDVPSKNIYEDEIVKVIMNINPEQNGDLLILLKRHATDFTKLNDEDVTHINKVLKDMAELVKEKLECTGFEVITNSGTCQEIKHFHVHLTPGYEPEQPIVDIDIMYDKLTN